VNDGGGNGARCGGIKVRTDTPIIFCPVVSIFYLLYFFLSFFPHLISAVGDWMSTILRHTFERRRSTSGAIVTSKGRSPALRRASSRLPGPSAWTSRPASVATVTFAGLRTFVVISHNPQSPSVCCARSLLRSRPTVSWGRWARICQLLSRRYMDLRSDEV